MIGAILIMLFFIGLGIVLAVIAKIIGDHMSGK